MESMEQFVFGPAQEGNVYLFALIDNQFYILRPDPNNPQYPYLSPINSEKNKAFMLFKLSTDGGYKLTSSDGTLIVNPADGYIELQNTTAGAFTYTFKRNSGTMPLYVGEEFKLMQEGITGIFPYKTISGEEFPEHTGTVPFVFIVPETNYIGTNCSSESKNGAYLAYYGDPQYQTDYYTTENFCTVGANLPICPQGTECNSSCLGPCSDTSKFCGVTGNGQITCMTEEDEEAPWYTSWWFYLVLLFIVFLIIVGVIFFLIKVTSGPKNPPKVKVLYM